MWVWGVFIILLFWSDARFFFHRIATSHKKFKHIGNIFACIVSQIIITHIGQKWRRAENVSYMY